MHNNHYRSIVFNVERVPKVCYNVYKSKFIKPTLEEGFDEIETIQFKHDFTDNEELLKKWKMWYL